MWKWQWTIQTSVLAGMLAVLVAGVLIWGPPLRDYWIYALLGGVGVMALALVLYAAGEWLGRVFDRVPWLRILRPYRLVAADGPMETAVPVLTKELRSRARGKRLWWAIAGATVFAMLLLGLMFVLGQYDLDGDIQFALESCLAGVLVITLTPGLTAPSISLEHEQQTIDFLRLTQLSGFGIILGKWLAALWFAGAIMLVPLVLALLGIFIDPYDLGEKLLNFSLALLLLIGTASSFTAIGLWCSARLRKTATATGTAYGVCAAWLIGMPLLFFLFNSYQHWYDVGNIFIFLWMAILLSLLLAILPTALVIGIRRLRHRPPLPRAGVLMVWGICAIGLCALLNLPDAIDIIAMFTQDNSPMFFFANPAFCFLDLFEGGPFYSEPPLFWTSLITCLLSQLFITWLALNRAARQVAG